MRSARRLVVLTAVLAIGVPAVVTAGSVLAPPERTAAAGAPAQTPAVTAAPAAPAATPKSPVPSADPDSTSATPAPSTTAASPGSDVSRQFDQRAADETLAYWTPERMAAAKPLPFPSESGAQPSPTPAAEPTTVPSTVDLQAATGVGGSTVAVARPYTSAPARMEVRIFFKVDGQDSRCSGTVVNSRSKRMVDTAGHCVSDGRGRYYSDFTVVPAYSSQCSGCKDEPYGAWTARTVTTRAEWLYHENAKQDLAYIVTNDQNGRRIADVVGGVGTKFDIGRNQRWAATGYPARPPFNGFDQYVSVSGRVADGNPEPARPGPWTIGIASSMTKGCSGGGWMTGPYTNGVGYLNGHNSYRPIANPEVNDFRMYSPYYGDEALALFNYTSDLG